MQGEDISNAVASASASVSPHDVLALIYGTKWRIRVGSGLDDLVEKSRVAFDNKSSVPNISRISK